MKSTTFILPFQDKMKVYYFKFQKYTSKPEMKYNNHGN